MFPPIGMVYVGKPSRLQGGIPHRIAVCPFGGAGFRHTCRYSLTRTPARSSTTCTLALWVQGKSTPYAHPPVVWAELTLTRDARTAASDSRACAFIARVMEPITAVQVPTEWDAPVPRRESVSAPVWFNWLLLRTRPPPHRQDMRESVGGCREKSDFLHQSG